MVTLAVVLLVIAIILFAVEVFIPGFGVFGITGVILAVFSCVLTVLYVPFGAFIVLGEALFLGAAVYSLFQYITKKQLHGKLILEESLDYENQEIGDPESFMGKEGMALTALRPFGTVDFNGVTMEVTSIGPYINEGSRVKVTGATKQKITVQQVGRN